MPIIKRDYVTLQRCLDTTPQFVGRSRTDTMVLFGDSISFDLGVISAIACVAVYVYIARSRSKWLKMGVPISDPAFLLGNMTDVIFREKHMNEMIKDFYLKNRDKPCVTFYAFTKPMVMINDLELVRQVLIKDFHVFTNRHSRASPNEPLAFWNMSITRGDFWRYLRHKLSPTFTSGKLKKMFEIIDTCGNEFVSHLRREMDQNGDILIKEAAARYTSDIITSAAFGVEGDAMKNKDSVFRSFMRKSTEPTPVEGIKFLLFFLYPSILEKFDLRILRPDVTEFARTTVWSTVQYREKNNIKRHDFLDLMMQLRSKGYIEEDDSDSAKQKYHDANSDPQKGKIEFDGDVFVSQCLLFINAGFETSSTTISWALYELALHPDLQQRAYEEIERVLKKHGKVTYEAIQEMEYLQRVIQETLRKYPVLPFLDRETLRPYIVPGTNIVLKKGQGVLIPAAGIHYDPDIYPEPDNFDPERFTPENVQSRPACSFLGFGDGPRNCIGMRFGLLQTKVGLTYLLKNFSVKPSERTAIPVEFDKDSLVPSAKGGLILKLEKRSQ